MRRVTGIVALIIALGLGFLVQGLTGPSIAAQDEATPASDAVELGDGVFAEAIAVSGDQPVIYRLTLEPGASFDGDEADQSISLAYVETGELTVTVGAPVAVTRQGSEEAPEVFEADKEFTVSTGDYFSVPPLTEATVTNNGSETAMLLVAALLPPTAAEASPEAE